MSVHAGSATQNNLAEHSWYFHIYTVRNYVVLDKYVHELWHSLHDFDTEMIRIHVTLPNFKFCFVVWNLITDGYI